MAQLEALEAAIAKGVLEVQYGNNNRVKYQSTAAMLKVRGQMRRELGLTSSTSQVRTPRFCKGLG